MPRPPIERSSIPAEADFNWAMERLEHAVTMHQPPRQLGIVVKRELEHELIPPSEKNSNYTARVSILSKTTFIHNKPISPAEKRKRQKQKAEREAARRNAERDPLARPGEDPLTGSTTIDEELVALDQGASIEAVDRTAPLQELEIDADFQLEYIDGVWKQLNRAEQEHIQLWFDYALQQGDYAL